MRILISGAGGQLGAFVAEYLSPRHDVLACTRRDLDVTKHAQVRAAVRQHRPDAVINCSAYNEVDAAEDEVLRALEVNAIAVARLGREALQSGARFVHYSSDFVFDGEGSAPYRETDAPSPRSVYGLSKLTGELLVRDLPGALILRVESLFGGKRPRSSVDRIVQGLEHGDEVHVFVDRTVSPSFVADVASATERLLLSGATGLFHVVNSGEGTWEQVAQESARLLGVTPRLKPIRMGELSMRAARPLYCALSNEKLRAAGIEMPHWTDALARYISSRGRCTSLV